MEAAAARVMAGAAALMPLKTPVRFTSMIRAHSSCGYSSIRPKFTMPALLTRTLRLPNAVTASLTAASQSAGCVTSSRTYRTLSPSRAASCRPSSSRTSPTTTFAPSSRNRCAMAAPMPRAPPLTRATLPSNRPIASPFRERASPGTRPSGLDFKLTKHRPAWAGPLDPKRSATDAAGRRRRRGRRRPFRAARIRGAGCLPAAWRPCRPRRSCSGVPPAWPPRRRRRGRPGRWPCRS